MLADSVKMRLLALINISGGGQWIAPKPTLRLYLSVSDNSINENEENIKTPINSEKKNKSTIWIKKTIPNKE